MSCLFMREVAYSLFDHFDRTMFGSNLVIRRLSSMAISWHSREHGSTKQYFWGGTISILLETHAILLLLAALLVFVTTLIQRNQIIFAVYCLVLSTAVFLRVFVFLSILEPSSGLHKTTIDLAVVNLEKYKMISNSEFLSTITTFMINARCCGLNGPNDFLHARLAFNKSNFLFPYNPYRGADIYFPPGNVSHTFKIPPVCCKPYIFNEGTEDHAFKAIDECARGHDESVIQWTGCIQRFEELMEEHHGFILAMLTLMFSIEAMALVLAVYISLIEKKSSEVMRDKKRSEFMRDKKRSEAMKEKKRSEVVKET